VADLQAGEHGVQHPRSDIQRPTSIDRGSLPEQAVKTPLASFLTRS
jgi:hypothetical protein